MKIKYLLAAQSAFEALSNAKIESYSDRYHIYQKGKQMRDALGFFGAEERALAEKYGTVKADGGIEFADDVSRGRYAAARGLLLETDVDAGPPLCLGPLEDIGLTPAAMLALDGLVEFGAPKEG